MLWNFFVFFLWHSISPIPGTKKSVTLGCRTGYYICKNAKCKGKLIIPETGGYLKETGVHSCKGDDSIKCAVISVNDFMKKRVESIAII